MAEKTVQTTGDLTKVKPYGDTLNDGKVEMAFTLPVPYGEEAEECAKQYVKMHEWGIDSIHRAGPTHSPCVLMKS